MQKPKESMKTGNESLGNDVSGLGSKEGGEASGTSDKHYNLVSILYHALKGADTYAQYVSDAEQSGDQDLVQFFQQVQDEERGRAERAKELLSIRLGQKAQRRAA